MKLNQGFGNSVVSLIILSAFISSCGIKQEVKETRDAALDALNDGIQKMGVESAQWRNVLEETRERLIKEGQSTLANEVSNVASRAASDAGIEAKCYTDFLRDRTREELIKIRARITKEKLELKPVFCNPTPKSINMNLSAERRPIIEIAGYNLTRQSIKVFLVEDGSSVNSGGSSVGKQGNKIDISEHLSNPTNYLLTLDLGGKGVPLSSKSKQILFELPNGETRSISVIQPPPPKPKPNFLSRSIRVVGKISLNDDEIFGKDENKVIDIDQIVKVTADKGGEFSWEGCVGKEVQGYISAKLQLDRNTGKVTANGITQYYEGTRCGRTNSHGNHPINFDIPINGHHVYQATLKDRDGHVIVNLDFSNR